ncbi:MAG: 1-deoxy-D-xylulose-5-phosphate synthase [Candidatus Acidiferrales bacterium]
MKPRVMYIESKSIDGISGPARIGRVEFSQSGQSVYYRGRRFQTLAGRGFKANYFDCETGAQYWFSGCKKRGGDRLYPGTIEIDNDVLEEYWVEIRGIPESRDQRIIRCSGKHGGKAKRAK